MWHQSTVSLSTADVGLLSDILSADERARAARFVFDRDRRDFIAAHALLRRALSTLCHRPAAEWRFEADRFGKPAVACDQATPEAIACSLSHTRGLVACAVAAGDAALGVDVEEISTLTHHREIALRHFSSAEQKMLDAVDPCDYATRFTEVWTLKEAYLKALGVGLAQSLTAFSFGFGSGSNLRFAPAPPAEPADWTFAVAVPADGYRLALAIRCAGERSPTIRWRSRPRPVIVRRTLAFPNGSPGP